MKQALNLMESKQDRAVLKAIKMKKRHRDITDIRQFFEYTQKKALEAGDESVFDLKFEDMIAYFRKLAKANKGEVIDVPGEPLRFGWFYRHDSVVNEIENKGKLIPFKSKPGTVRPVKAVKHTSAPAAKKSAPTPFKRNDAQFVKNDLKFALAQAKKIVPSTGSKVAYIALRPTMVLRLDLPNDFKESDREMINMTLKAILA